MTGLIPSNFNALAAAATLIPLKPTAASSIAEGVDHLYFFLTVITLFFTILIFGTIFFFMIKYRRRSPDEIPPDTKEHLGLELTWTIIPTMITRLHFCVGVQPVLRKFAAAGAATEIFVVGKQWMWHIQHPEGVREINELHVPVNVPISSP